MVLFKPTVLTAGLFCLLAAPAAAGDTPAETAAVFQDRIASLGRHLRDKRGSPRQQAAVKQISEFILFPSNGFFDVGSQAAGLIPIRIGTTRAVQGKVHEAVSRWTAANPNSAAQILAVIGEDDELAEAGHQGLFSRASGRARTLHERLMELRDKGSDAQGGEFPALKPDDIRLASRVTRIKGYGDVGSRAERFLNLSSSLSEPLNAEGPPDGGFSFGSMFKGLF